MTPSGCAIHQGLADSSVLHPRRDQAAAAALPHAGQQAGPADSSHGHDGHQWRLAVGAGELCNQSHMAHSSGAAECRTAAHCGISQLRYCLLATSQWKAQPCSMQLLHAAQVQDIESMSAIRALYMCRTHPLRCCMQHGGKTYQMGHTLWTSMTQHVQSIHAAARRHQQGPPQG
jgi:hypothetical protein